MMLHPTQELEPPANPERFSPARSNMHFNTLDGLKYQNAQPSVEDIQIGYGA